MATCGSCFRPAYPRLVACPRRSVRPPAPAAARVLVVAIGLALGLGLVGAFVVPRPAAAHAELVLADPAPGTGLPQAPGAVVLKFSEPLDLGLSHIEIVDAAGHDVSSGPTRAVSGDADAMRRAVEAAYWA